MATAIIRGSLQNPSLNAGAEGGSPVVNFGINSAGDVVLYFNAEEFLFLPEVNSYRINTVAKTGFGGAVVEYVSEMPTTFSTQHFGTYHSIGVIRLFYNTLAADCAVVTGPSAMTVELAF